MHKRFYSAIILWLLSYEKTLGDVSAMFDVPEGRLEALRKNAYMFAGECQGGTWRCDPSHPPLSLILPPPCFPLSSPFAAPCDWSLARPPSPTCIDSLLERLCCTPGRVDRFCKKIAFPFFPGSWAEIRWGKTSI